MIFGDDYDTPDGTGVRDYIHVVDLALGHIAAIENCREAGVHIYNLGTGVGYSVLDMVHAFEKACGKTLPYEICPRRSGDVAECYANGGQMLKRMQPVSKGRGHAILKRTSHITVILDVKKAEGEI